MAGKRRCCCGCLTAAGDGCAIALTRSGGSGARPPLMAALNLVRQSEPDTDLHTKVCVAARSLPETHNNLLRLAVKLGKLAPELVSSNLRQGVWCKIAPMRTSSVLKWLLGLALALVVVRPAHAFQLAEPKQSGAIDRGFVFQDALVEPNDPFLACVL